MIGGKYEFCPNGNYWQDVSGIFDHKITLFCDCDKCKGQFYLLRPINITSKIPKERIEKIRQWNKLDEIVSRVTLENMDEVLQTIEDKKLLTHNAWALSRRRRV